MKKTQLPLSRKLRQFRYLAKRLNKRLERNPGATPERILKKLHRLYGELSLVFSQKGLQKILAGAAILLGLGMGNKTLAQNFAAPIINPFGFTDRANFALPAFADLDGDGDQDLLTGVYYGGLVYFEDTSSVGNPTAFGAPLTNPFGLSSTYIFANPEFVDIDNDGDQDLFVAEYYGTIQFFQNTGTPTAPTFAAPVTNPFGITSGYYVHMPAFADLDNDGDFDLIATEYYGNFRYFQNTGTATAPAFAPVVTNPFNLAAHASASYTFPSFADIDNDGDEDLFVGDLYGGFYYYQNTGTQTVPAFAMGTLNPFGLTPLTQLSCPDLVDIDMDGDLDLFSNSTTYSGGNYNGSLAFFENTGGIINAPPVVDSIGSQVICENDTVGPISFMASDPNNDPITLMATSNNQTLIPDANIQVLGAAPNFTLEAIPVMGQIGMADITLAVADSADTTRQTFNVMVNTCTGNPPVISQVGTQTICDGDTLGPLGFTVTDPDGDPVTITTMSSNQALLPNGNITLGGTAPNFIIGAIPLPGQTGISNITVTATDSLNPAVTMVFSLVVTDCNVPPIISQVPTQTVCDGDTLGPLSFTVTDADGDPITLTANSNNQSVLLDANISLMGMAPNFTLTAITTSGSPGTAIVVLTANDGTAQTTSNFVVQVNDCNVAPTVSPVQDQMICKDEAFGPLSITAVDPDGDPISVSATSNNQTLMPDANLVLAGVAPNFSLIGTPATGQTGTATIMVTATDGILSDAISFQLEVDGCLSVENLGIPAGFTLSPIPVQDLLTASWNEQVMVEQIQVLDLQGRVIQTEMPHAILDSWEIPTDRISNGIYFLHIQTEKGMFTGKFLKE